MHGLRRREARPLAVNTGAESESGSAFPVRGAGITTRLVKPRREGGRESSVRRRAPEQAAASTTPNGCRIANRLAQFRATAAFAAIGLVQITAAAGSLRAAKQPATQTLETRTNPWPRFKAPDTAPARASAWPRAAEIPSRALPVSTRSANMKTDCGNDDAAMAGVFKTPLRRAHGAGCPTEFCGARLPARSGRRFPQSPPAGFRQIRPDHRPGGGNMAKNLMHVRGHQRGKFRADIRTDRCGDDGLQVER